MICLIRRKNISNTYLNTRVSGYHRRLRLEMLVWEFIAVTRFLWPHLYKVQGLHNILGG